MLRQFLRAALLAAVAALPVPAQGRADPGILAAWQLIDGSVQALSPPAVASRACRIAVPLDRPCTLELHPHDVRAPGFRLLVAGDDGVRQAAKPPAVTMRGAIAGEAGSLVAATLTAEGLTAVVRRGSGELWGIQPLGSGLHLVYRDADRQNLPWACGTAAPPPRRPPPEAAAPPESAMVTTAELACEADFAFFQANGGSVTATHNDITGVINAVDAIYQRDVMIAHQITTILVRQTAAADPYTTNDPNGLLGQFRGEWNTNQTAVPRDVAHLFTGRNMTGPVIGIAFLEVICQVRGAYGVSQSAFTRNLVSRVGLTAHELGHNWGAFHCNGDPDCRIMCSGLGGCSNNLGAFGSRSIAAISAHRDTRLCLSLPPPAPALTSLSPAQVPAFQPGTVTLQGSGFSVSTGLQLGALTLLPGRDYTVVDNGTIRFRPPPPAGLGQVPVRVTGPGGTSGSLALTWQPTDPPRLLAPLAAIGGLQAPFSFGGRPGQDWYLLVSLSSATVPLQGFPVLRDFSVLGFGSLDGAGLGGIVLPVPAGVLTGITFQTQLLTFDPATLGLAGASGVHPTMVFL